MMLSMENKESITLYCALRRLQNVPKTTQEMTGDSNIIFNVKQGKTELILANNKAMFSFISEFQAREFYFVNCMSLPITCF